jgi:catechol 2,3-dioxygenase-like lactoylglutathione lyase family enzyme
MTDISVAPPKTGFVIYAKDKERLADFYTRTIGMVAVEDGDDFVVLESSSTQLVIRNLPPDMAAKVTVDTPPVARTNAAIKPSFVVKSLRLACEAAIAAGGNAKSVDTLVSFLDHNVIDGCDPEGNVIQFRQLDG